MDFYGTLGPKCSDEKMIEEMFRKGMTGMRLNLSHTTLLDAKDLIFKFQNAAKTCKIKGKLLIDMQGPELRIGKLDEKLILQENEEISSIPMPIEVVSVLEEGMTILLDDGKIKAKVIGFDKKPCGERMPILLIIRGGILSSGKSIAISDFSVQGNAVTAKDFENLKHAKEFGVTAIMQPFVRGANDLKTVREAMKKAGCEDISLFAKIENMSGIEHIEELFAYADEIVIARGDLGNAMPLWELPAMQMKIAEICNRHQMPFMVVTQMLASMEHRAVPTRAEVNDVFRAVLDGANSLMVTAETAVGDYPIEVISYLCKTAKEAEKYILGKSAL